MQNGTVEFIGVCKAYGEKTVLNNLSLKLPQTGAVAVTGPSGCGKTTLLRLIAGLEPPDAGEILLPRKAKISMVFQEDRLLPHQTARGNILAVLQGKAAGDIADECLSRCGIREEAGTLVSKLSGGMRRRVAIARALAYGGDILLMDEPFKGLDGETKAQVAGFVFENKNRLILYVTHNGEEAAWAKTLISFSDSGEGVGARLETKE